MWGRTYFVEAKSSEFNGLFLQEFWRSRVAETKDVNAADIQINCQYAGADGKQHHHTIGPLVLYLFIRHRCTADKRIANPFSGYSFDILTDSFASGPKTTRCCAYRNRGMVAFNDCSINYVVDHDIQCGQLRGFNDEGQDNLGIGKPQRWIAEAWKQNC